MVSERRSLVFVALGLVAALCARVYAGPNDEAEWARAIRDGLIEQDRELRRSTPKAVLLRYESGAARPDADLATTYLLGRAYGKAGDMASALATYGDVIKREPRCWFAWRDRGFLKANQRDGKGQIINPAGAEADLKQALALKPDYVEALGPLAKLLLESKRWDEAVALLQRVLLVEPGNDPARVQIVEALRAAQRPDDALKSLQPLLSQHPNDATYRFLWGVILKDKKDWKGSQAIFKQLMFDNPTSDAPIRAWIDVTQSSPEPDRDQLIWAADRLLRVVKSAEEKKNISEYIQRLRAATAASAAKDPKAPPSPAQLAAVLRGTDPVRRTLVLTLLATHPNLVKEVGADLVAALIERLSPTKEPDPANRVRTLAIFGMLKADDGGPVGRQYGALLRGSLTEKEDPDVRAKAADVLGQIGALAEVPALELHTRGKDPAMALAARAAIYALAKVVAPLSDDTPEAHVAAFVSWWQSPDRVDFKLSVIREVLASAQVTPEDMLIPFLIHETDARIWSEAYKALRVVAQDIAKAFEKAPPSPGKSRGDWMRSLPTILEADLTAEKRNAVLDAVATWFLKRP